MGHRFALYEIAKLTRRISYLLRHSNYFTVINPKRNKRVRNFNTRTRCGINFPFFQSGRRSHIRNELFETLRHLTVGYFRQPVSRIICAGQWPDLPDDFLLIIISRYLIHDKEREMSATLCKLTGAKSEYGRVGVVN